MCLSHSHYLLTFPHSTWSLVLGFCDLQLGIETWTLRSCDDAIDLLHQLSQNPSVHNRGSSEFVTAESQLGIVKQWQKLCPTACFVSYLKGIDPKLYTRIDLAQLYRLRWQAEIDLKHLKTTMQMEHPPSKTPSMVRKDFYVHLLAYNLIRTVQFSASRQHTVDPLVLSFQATIQHLTSFTCLLAHATDEQRRYEYEQLIFLVSTEKLPFRPNRVEPRAVKRRPKAYPRLTKPRRQLKRKLMNDRYFPRVAA